MTPWLVVSLLLTQADAPRLDSDGLLPAHVPDAPIAAPADAPPPPTPVGTQVLAATGAFLAGGLVTAGGVAGYAGTPTWANETRLLLPLGAMLLTPAVAWLAHHALGGTSTLGRSYSGGLFGAVVGGLIGAAAFNLGNGTGAWSSLAIGTFVFTMWELIVDTSGSSLHVPVAF
jgi:hypothetical protein